MRMVNPTMLLLARESRGLTQSALAREIGVAQSTLSKAELGHADLSDEVINKLADHLNYPRDFFYEEKRFSNLPITFFRKRARISQTAVKAVTAHVNIHALRVLKLIQSADLPELRVPKIELAEYRGDVEAVAREIRLQLNLPPGPIANLTKRLEDAGILIIECDFGTEQIDGLSIWEYEIGLPPIIFVSNRTPGDRLRFTLAHEYCHVLLHLHQPIPNVTCEDEADRFAAEFLMPTRDIQTDFRGAITLQRIAQMKPYWKTSMASLIFKASSMGRLTDRQKVYLWQQMSKFGYRSQEPLPIPRERPTLFGELIDFHCDDLGYTLEELSSVLRTNLQEFCSLYSREMGLRLVR